MTEKNDPGNEKRFPSKVHREETTPHVSSGETESRPKPITVIYQTPEGTWRGLVHPYDVTTEMDTRAGVERALKGMTRLYEKMLDVYGWVDHLAYKAPTVRSDFDALIEHITTTHRDEIVRRLEKLHEIYDIADAPHISKKDAIATVNDVYKGKIADV